MIPKFLTDVAIVVLIIFILHIVYRLIIAYVIKESGGLTEEDYNHMYDRYIIQNKDKFSKKEIQKAQQRFDAYLDDMNQ